jgi:hypothetical protein
MPSIRKDSGWVKVPRDPAVSVDPDRLGVENYVRTVQFGTSLNQAQFEAFRRQLEENSSCPGLRVDGELMFGTNSTPAEYRFVTVYSPARHPSMLHLTAVTPSGMSLLFGSPEAEKLHDKFIAKGCHPDEFVEQLHKFVAA